MRWLVIIVSALMTLTSCSLVGGDDTSSPSSDETSGGETTPDVADAADAQETAGDPSSAQADESTTTTAAPILLALSSNLALLPGQCFADEPPPAETTTTTEPPEPETSEGDTTTTTIVIATEPTAPTTTLPRPPTVAVVDCTGTKRGYVYAVMCLGSLASRDDRVIDRPEDLGQVGCPGEIGLDWPGDRLLRRAGARVCLSVFENLYGESYALSDISTEEFVPSKGVWAQTDRRLVCAAAEPPP